MWGRFIAGVFLLIAFNTLGAGIVIYGVSDQGIYSDSVDFGVQTNVGWNYEATLNGVPITVGGVSHTVDRMDYYELLIQASEQTSGRVTNAFVRFIVRSSWRNDSETGLSQWTPYPAVRSTASELIGATLHLVAPQNYPVELDIPLIAWVADNEGKIRRINGNVIGTNVAPSFIGLTRGYGFSLLLGATKSGTISYIGKLQTLQTIQANKQINIGLFGFGTVGKGLYDVLHTTPTLQASIKKNSHKKC